MPELCRFEGMIIRMLYKDDVQHHKPHVHVACGEYQASIGIDGELLAGSLPVKKLALLRAWLILREDQLYAAWNNAVREIPFGKIEPLR
jgi:hypothetical protein